MNLFNKDLPLYLYHSELDTLDFWEWSVDEEAELAVAEWVRARGVIDVEPARAKNARFAWCGISNPGEPLEQRGSIWRPVDMGFPAYEFDLPSAGRPRKQLAMPGLPWKQRTKRQHKPAFRYCVYCGGAATHNILKQTYCETHYRLAKAYRAWEYANLS